jgi:hypothetical protein
MTDEVDTEDLRRLFSELDEVLERAARLEAHIDEPCMSVPYVHLVEGQIDAAEYVRQVKQLPAPGAKYTQTGGTMQDHPSWDDTPRVEEVAALKAKLISESEATQKDIEASRRPDSFAAGRRRGMMTMLLLWADTLLLPMLATVGLTLVSTRGARAVFGALRFSFLEVWLGIAFAVLPTLMMLVVKISNRRLSGPDLS